MNLPTRIRRRWIRKAPGGLLRRRLTSLRFGRRIGRREVRGAPIAASAIIVADLNELALPRSEKLRCGRSANQAVWFFPRNQLPKQGVSVYYQYGFSADIGGGEYDRPISQPADARLYRVGAGGDFKTINDALKKWASDKQRLRSLRHATASTATDGKKSGLRGDRNHRQRRLHRKIKCCNLRRERESPNPRRQWRARPSSDCWITWRPA